MERELTTPSAVRSAGGGGAQVEHSHMPLKRVRRLSATASCDDRSSPARLVSSSIHLSPCEAAAAVAVTAVPESSSSAKVESSACLACPTTSDPTSRSTALAAPSVGGILPQIHSEPVVCGVTLETTTSWVRTACCQQAVSSSAFFRLWLGGRSPRCPFCRTALPEVTPEVVSGIMGTASSAARQLLETLPGLYADLVMRRLVTGYASAPHTLAAACAKLADTIQLTEPQLERLCTLEPEAFQGFCVTSALCMFQNWLDVLPGTAACHLLPLFRPCLLYGTAVCVRVAALNAARACGYCLTMCRRADVSASWRQATHRRRCWRTCCRGCLKRSCPVIPPSSTA